MKILAVIPARAGSKGIPNKNIRIINGKPLVYYAIKNAISSKFITDIIVTTDSEEVKTIAKQMGVNVKNRDKSLSGDSITLDSVIFDAIPKDTKWDYIITMQPTSPTLKTNTLDDAIEYAITKDLDTLISAINKPHLSWGIKDGVAVPNYVERLNRQYLPPCFMETGAFVISKFVVVSQYTRIGRKIDIYNLSDEEAIDVDTFDDLALVKNILKKQTVAIYVNGNNKRGVGHIYRALELADEFYCKPDIFYDINQTDAKVFGNTTHNLIPINGIAELFKICEKNKYSLFINDILTTSVDYMIGLKTVMPDAKIINFEDDGEGQIKADLVFNALLSHNNLPNVYAGEKYYISGKSFMFYTPITINENVKRVFISFGGADPQNYSDRLLKIISKNEYEKYHFVVVLGRAKHNISSLLEYNNAPNIEVLYDVKNMPEIMSSCDIAITSRGRTGYELAILGIPSIAMAQNEREEKHGFVSNENGFTYIGLNPDDEIIESNLKMYLNMSKKSRERFHAMLLSHDLKGGRERVMKLINSL